MKNKLKTLEDVYPMEHDKYAPNEDWYNPNIIREVAREWIRDFKKVINETYEYTNEETGECDDTILNFYDSEYDTFCYVERWIKYFFNLDDEKQ